VLALSVAVGGRGKADVAGMVTQEQDNAGAGTTSAQYLGLECFELLENLHIRVRGMSLGDSWRYGYYIIHKCLFFGLYKLFAFS
jgi:hypothetical protein